MHSIEVLRLYLRTMDATHTRRCVMKPVRTAKKMTGMNARLEATWKMFFDSKSAICLETTQRLARNRAPWRASSLLRMAFGLLTSLVGLLSPSGLTTADFSANPDVVGDVLGEDLISMALDPGLSSSSFGGLTISSASPNLPRLPPCASPETISSSPPSQYV